MTTKAVCSPMSTAFMLNGELVEHSPTEKLFTTPHDARTEEYVTGKFG